MSGVSRSLEEDILLLYREPVIGSNYTNSYGEENIKNLVEKYRSLDAAGMGRMMELLVRYSQSPDLTSSYVSVGVLHALGRAGEVGAAYRWAEGLDDAHLFTSHFDIGKSLAEHFVGK